MTRIVLAYSGSLATSVAIPWLREQGYAEVIAVALDLGQGRELNQIRERAISAGAIRCHVLDVRDEFLRDYLLRALQAGAMQEACPTSEALESPLIAKKLIEIVRIENAAAVAHGGGNGASRIDIAVRAMDPAIAIVAPARIWQMTPGQLVEYGRTRNVTVSTGQAGGHQISRNLWGRSTSCGPLDDPWKEPSDELYTLTKSAEHAPGTPAYADIEWAAGVPLSVNGVGMPLTELIDSLETIAGAHGVGRTDNRWTGPESCAVHESPAGAVLHAAHHALERVVTPKDLHRIKQRLAEEYASLVGAGSWCSPTRVALDALVATVQRRVTGFVRMKLYKGACRTIGVKSAFALDDHAIAAGEAAHAGAAIE